MKFKIKVCHVENENDFWWENYDKDEVTNPDVFGFQLVEKYNNSLRHHDKQRKYLGFERIDDSIFVKKNHDWYKTNLITMISGKLCYDTYQCLKCGITGKRFGLNDIIVKDPKYKAEKYNNCTGK
jgi:hypothetical protein